MPVWLPFVMMALGSAMKNKQTKAAGKRMINEQRIGRKKENKVEDAQRKDTLDTAKTFDPGARQGAMDTRASEAEARINDVLAGNKITTTGDVGVISNDLLAQRAKSTREKANRASIMAALSSKVQAPTDVAQDEEMTLGDLGADTRGRSSKLGRIGKTAKTLTQLEGRTDSSAMLLAGLISSMGMSAASGSIMNGLQAPPPSGIGTTQMSPVPNYTKPDAFGTAGIR